MIVDIILMILLVLTAALTVATARLLRAAIGLALTSALLTAVMVRLDSPIAAVFELSVCAGLIPAIFITAVGMTRRLDCEALVERRKEKIRRFWLLPVLLILAGTALSQAHLPAGFAPAAPAAAADVRNVLWSARHMDLLGQIIVLLGGAFGVVVLVMEPERER
jgi:NADH-quinone oxidoreductase subunit J